MFTYLSPLLQEVTGFKAGTVAVILLGYGIAIAIGNMIGGRLSNRNPIAALFYMFIVQALVLFVLAFTAPYQTAGLITILCMGLLAFMNVPGLQVYVVMLAERFVPSAVDVASAMNIAALMQGLRLAHTLRCDYRFNRTDSHRLDRRINGSRCSYLNRLEPLDGKRDRQAT